MFAPRFVYSALILLSFSAVLPQVVHAQATMPAPASPAASTVATDKVEQKFTLSYQDNLLSFREDGKAFLFAKTLTSKTIAFRLETGTGQSGCKITLRDEGGKMLWSDTVPWQGRNGKGQSGVLGFNTKMHGGLSLTLSTKDTTVKSSEGKSSKGVLTATLRSDNSIVQGQLDSDDTHVRMEMLKDDSGMVLSTLEDGKWREAARFQADPEKQGLLAVANGQEVISGNADKGLTLNDGNGPVTVKSITQDGKDYTEVKIGDRRLLIAGGNFNAETKDGTVIITTTPVPPTTTADGTK